MTTGLALAAALLAAAPAPDAPAGATSATPHPLSFQARAERAEVKLGEPFGYAIEVRHRAEEAYALPATPDLAPFRADGARCRRAEGKDEVTTTCTMRLALFTLGPQDVPEIPLAVTTPAGDAVLKVPGPRVTGVGIIDPAAPPEKLELRDIAPPAPVFVRSLALVWWTLGVLAAVAAALVAWRWWRGRGRPAEPPAPVPADVRFARRLEALEAERLPARGLGREHVARLSELVREYLGAVTGVNALDLTTEELVEAVARVGDPRVEPDALAGFLATADLVKFARAEPGVAACGAASAYAKQLLERTRAGAGVEPGDTGHGTRVSSTEKPGSRSGTGTGTPASARPEILPSPPAKRSGAWGEGQGEGGRPRSSTGPETDTGNGPGPTGHGTRVTGTETPGTFAGTGTGTDPTPKPGGDRQ